MDITPEEFLAIMQVIDEDLAIQIRQFDAIKNAKTLQIIPSLFKDHTTSYLYDVKKNVIIGEFNHNELTKIINSKCKPKIEHKETEKEALNAVVSTRDLAVNEKLRRGRKPKKIDAVEAIKNEQENIVPPHEITYQTRLCHVKNYLTKRAFNLLCNAFDTKDQTTLLQIAKLHPSNLAELKGFGHGALNSIADLFFLGSLSFSSNKKAMPETIDILACKD